MTIFMRYRQELRAEAVVEQGGRCHYCKSPITYETSTADHKWPQARNGRTTKGNIAATCDFCNAVKGSRSHIEMYKLTKRPLPAKNISSELLLIWAFRRINKRTERAISRIERFAR